MMTLWDLLRQAIAPAPPPPSAKKALRGPAAAGRSGAAQRRPPSGRKPAVRGRPAAVGSHRPTMAERYEQIARQYLQEHGIRVRKWRTHMSGIATEVKYKDGRITRYIECPRPRGPMSIAIFFHEIGHHAIGFNTYRPRCLEEYHAWRYALEHMERNGLNITESVRRRMHNSLRYAVLKAERRGIREIPAELEPFRGPWPGKERRPAPTRAR